MIDFTALDKKKLILIGLVGLVVLYLDFSFVISAGLKSLSNSESGIAKLRTDIDKLNRDLAAMQTQKAANNGLLNKRQAFIKEESVTQFLEQIQSMANESGVTVTQFKQSEAGVDAALVKSPVKPLKISIEISSTYHTLGTFINYLENCGVFVNIESFKVTTSASDIFRQNASMAMIIYVKK